MSARPRGPRTALTEAQQERIVALAEVRPDGTRRTAGRIAMSLGLSTGMVRWFMYRNGLLAPGRHARCVACTRKGVTVRGFSPAEDALMLRLRGLGTSFSAIADAFAELTNHRRRPSAIRTRLIMLAGFEAEAEERAELQAEAMQPRRRAA